MKKKIDFHKEGQKGDMTASNTSKVEDKRWGGLTMVSTDLESRLVFPVVTIIKPLDLFVWSMKKKHVMLLEMTIPWEKTKWEELVKACTEKS